MAQASGRQGKTGKLPAKAAAAAAKGAAKDPPAPGEPFTLTTLEQVRVLSHPLRVRILESLVTERTTKQVAELLGEKPTRLYHHVAALERIGLVRLTRRRRNRGTVEKYYRALACTFRADPRLFDSAAARRAGGSVVESLLARASGEVAALLRSESGGALEEEGLVSFIEIHAPERSIRSLQRRLQGILKGLEKDGGRDPGPAPRRFRLVLAFYPLDTDRER